MAKRYRVRRHVPKKPVCSCGTEANYEVVGPDGYVFPGYCSTCAEQAADDLNSEVTNSQEGDEVR